MDVTQINNNSKSNNNRSVSKQSWIFNYCVIIDFNNNTKVKILFVNIRAAINAV